MIDKIDFYMFSSMMSKLGGSLSIVYGFFKIMSFWRLIVGWESSINKSVFNTSKPTTSQLKILKSRISYQALFNLHDTIAQTQSESKVKIIEIEHKIQTMHNLLISNHQDLITNTQLLKASQNDFIE